MYIFAVAVRMERKEAGMYSRTVDTAMMVIPVRAEEEIEAERHAQAEARFAYPAEKGWVFAGSRVTSIPIDWCIEAASEFRY